MINKDVKLVELLRQMNEIGGFTAKKLATGIEIFESMKNDKECIKFLSFPACIISTGLRGVIKDLIKNKLVDVVITTCGTLDHDLARTWKDYYEGSFDMNDAELYKKGINRLGNILIPNESYGIILEDKMQSMLKEIAKEKSSFSTREIIHEFGKRIDNEDSILYWTYKNNIPIFVPGITDGAFGSQLWMFRQKNKEFNIDVLKDEEELSEIIFKSKKTGALMLGGGISKHHTLWWNQYRDGLDYAFYITTAQEFDGSLSGALVREAISWGKVTQQARQATLHAEVTTILPFIYAALISKLKK